MFQGNTPVYVNPVFRDYTKVMLLAGIAMEFIVEVSCSSLNHFSA